MRTATRFTDEAKTSISESTKEAARASEPVKTAATSFMPPRTLAVTTLARAAATALRAAVVGSRGALPAGSAASLALGGGLRSARGDGPLRGGRAVLRAGRLAVRLRAGAGLGLLDARDELGRLAPERLDGVGELRDLGRALGALLETAGGGPAAAAHAAVEGLLGAAAQRGERALVAEEAQRGDRRHLDAEVLVVDPGLEALADRVADDEARADHGERQGRRRAHAGVLPVLDALDQRREDVLGGEVAEPAHARGADRLRPRVLRAERLLDRLARARGARAAEGLRRLGLDEHRGVALLEHVGERLRRDGVPAERAERGDDPAARLRVVGGLERREQRLARGGRADVAERRRRLDADAPEGVAAHRAGERLDRLGARVLRERAGGAQAHDHARVAREGLPVRVHPAVELPRREPDALRVEAHEVGARGQGDVPRVLAVLHLER